MLYTGAQRHRASEPPVRETLDQEQRARVQAVLDSEFGGVRSDVTSLQKPVLSTTLRPAERDPLPEPHLPELRQLIRYVCALERTDHGAGDVDDERDKRKVQVRIESGLEPTTRGEHLACISAAARLVRLCIFEGKEQIAIMDGRGNWVRVEDSP